MTTLTRTGDGRLPSVLAGLTGPLSTVAAFYGLVRYQRQQVEYEFERDAANRVQAVHHALDMSIGAVESLAALYAASSHVEPDEFDRFVRPLLAREPGLRTVAARDPVILAPDGRVLLRRTDCIPC